VNANERERQGVYRSVDSDVWFEEVKYLSTPMDTSEGNEDSTPAVRR